MTQFSLGEKGIELRLLNTDKFTRNSLSVNFLVKLDENASKNALLAAVMKITSKKYPTINALNDYLERLYGATFSASVSKKGEMQMICFGVSFIADCFAISGENITEKMMQFLADMIFEPLLINHSFKDEIVKTEKINLINKIQSRVNDKFSYANTRCIETMCEDEAYSLDELGKIEEIEKLNGSDLYEQYHNLIKNSKVIVFGMGRFDEDNVKNWVTKQFDFERKSVEISTKYIEKASKIKEKDENMAINQSKLVLGFRIGSKDYEDHMFSYIMFHIIYGGSPNSRLFLNVREKLSLCYYCSSRVDRLKGTMLVYSGVENKNRQLAQDEILLQLKQMTDVKNITQTDMDNALKTAENDYGQLSDSPASMETYYINCIIGNSCLTVSELVEGLRNVTAGDVVRVAKLISLDTIYCLNGTEIADENNDEDGENDE